MEKLIIKALRNRYRFETKRGLLGLEDLFAIPLDELDEMYAGYSDKIGKRNRLFEGDTSPETALNTEKAEIIKFVFKSKVDAIQVAEDRTAKDAHNSNIDALIKKKKEEELAAMSIEELEKLKMQ